MSKGTLHPAHSRRHKAPPPRAAATAAEVPTPRAAPAGAALDGPTFIEPQERRAMVAEAAYYRAERRGFEPGHELEDWLAAEADVERLLPMPDSPMVSGN